MIYIDINTKETYNGDMPYVHWFQQEMSIDLIYTHKICFLHQKPTLQLSLDSNIFNILNINNGTTYNDIKCQKMTANGIKCGDQYIYIIYFSASSTDENQYTTTVSIISDLGTEYLMIGADFYGPNESLYVNLSNMGVELPSQI